MIIKWKTRGKPSAVGFSVAAVCGLVAITPGSGFVTIPVSILLGLASGIISYLAANWRAKKTDIDDRLLRSPQGRRPFLEAENIPK